MYEVLVLLYTLNGPREEEKNDKEEVEGGAVVVIDNVDELPAIPEKEHRIIFRITLRKENNDTYLC
eukprot:778738-Ditylum_brightwellii.AAC.1